MKDRVVIGFVSGILGGIGTDIVNWALFSLGFTEVRFLEWASAVFLGHLPINTSEIIALQATQTVWDGLLGVLFVMLIPLIEPDHLIFKGLMYSLVLFLSFRAMSVLFDLVYLNDLPLNAFLSNVFCSIVWGVLTAFFVQRFANRLD